MGAWVGSETGEGGASCWTQPMGAWVGIRAGKTGGYLFSYLPPRGVAQNGWVPKLLSLFMSSGPLHQLSQFPGLYNCSFPCAFGLGRYR